MICVAGTISALILVSGHHASIAARVLLCLSLSSYFCLTATYVVHYYLDSILAALFACTDAHHGFVLWPACKQMFGSLEQRRGSQPIPHWHMWLFRAQILLVYFCGGRAKAQSSDWVLRAEPMTTWLTERQTVWHTLAHLLLPSHIIKQTMGRRSREVLCLIFDPSHPR